MKTRYPVASDYRPGFTLLEVLVACGILVVALASIAALLPAAASRLGQASRTDQAAMAAAVALSDIQLRDLTSPSLFPSAPVSSGVVFGEVMSTAVAVSATSRLSTMASGSLFSGPVAATGTSLSLNGNQILSAGTPALAARLVPQRGFTLENTLRFTPATTVTTTSGASITREMPRNAFAGGTTGTTGFRDFSPGVCWGAVVSPEPWGTSPAAMDMVRVNLGVFVKPTTARLMSLSGTAGSNIFTSVTLWPGAVQRSLLKPCSAVLALPSTTGPGSGPQWLRIRSSWLPGIDPLTTSLSQVSVAFDTTPNAQLLVSGTLLHVLAFEGLLLTDQRTVPVR